MALVDIQVTGAEEAIAKMEGVRDVVETLGQGLLEVVDASVLPAVAEASSTVWGVRTGDYSAGWIADLIDPSTVAIQNMVSYAAPLEFGWTTRNGGFVESQGVAVPTVLEMAPQIGQELVDWLKRQADL